MNTRQMLDKPEQVAHAGFIFCCGTQTMKVALTTVFVSQGSFTLKSVVFMHELYLK